MPAVVPHNENAHRVSNDSKQEMIWKAVHIHASNIPISNGKGFRALGSRGNKAS